MSIQDLRAAMARAYESPWHLFLRYVKEHGVSRELLDLAETVPSRERFGPIEWYADWTEVDTGDREGPVSEFAGFKETPDPLFSLVRALHFDAGSGLNQLRQWKHLGQIRALTLNSLHSPSGLLELLGHPGLSSLEFLCLNFLPMEDKSLTDKLLALPLFRRIKGFTMSWCRSSDKSVYRTWFNALRGIELLHILHCDLGGQGLRHLRDSDILRTVKDLRLQGVYMGPEESRLLAEHHGPFAVETLEIEDCALDNGGFEMDPAAFARFVSSPLCTSVKSFKSLYHRAGEMGAAALAASRMARGLTFLSLQNAALGNAGFRALLAGSWPLLRRLKISYDTLSGAMEAELKSWPCYPALEHCYIHSVDGFNSWVGLDRS